MAHLNNTLLVSAATPAINAQPSVVNSVIIIDITGV